MRNEVQELFKFDRAIVVCIDSRHQSVQNVGLNPDSQHAKHGTHLVKTEQAIPVQVKSFENIGQVKLDLLAVRLRQRSVPDDLNELANVGFVPLSMVVFTDSPLALNMSDEVLIRGHSHGQVIVKVGEFSFSELSFMLSEALQELINHLGSAVVRLVHFQILVDFFH